MRTAPHHRGPGRRTGGGRQSARLPDGSVGQGHRGHQHRRLARPGCRAGQGPRTDHQVVQRQPGQSEGDPAKPGSRLRRGAPQVHRRGGERHRRSGGGVLGGHHHPNRGRYRNAVSGSVLRRGGGLRHRRGTACGSQLLHDRWCLLPGLRQHLRTDPVLQPHSFQESRPGCQQGTQDPCRGAHGGGGPQEVGYRETPGSEA